MTQSFATVVLRFSAARTRVLENTLDELAAPAKARPLRQQLNAAQFAHFMSMVVVPAREDEAFAHLLVEVCADGHADAALDQLAQAIPGALEEVLEAAGLDVPPRDRLGAHLRGKKIAVDLDWRAHLGWFRTTTGLEFGGTPGMSVRRIHDEARLAARIRALLDADGDPSSAMARLARVRERIFADATLKWAFVSEPVELLGEAKKAGDLVRPLLQSGFRHFLWPLVPVPVLVLLHAWLIEEMDHDRALLRFGLAIAFELLIVVLAALIGYLRLRRQEKADIPLDREPDQDKMREILARENRPGMAQNHLAGVSILKPGPVRRVALRVAFWLIAELQRGLSRPGFLNSIGTIHFARWLLLPGTDRLVFLSNYDGSWQSYLEDFIARLRQGLSSVWSNTQNFPKTDNLIAGGAGDGARFKRWARRQQLPTRFWYSAYPQLTTARIRNNAAIRHGIAAASNEGEAAQWLALFGFPPPEHVDKEEICALAFGGLPFLRHARCLIIHLRAGDSARAWLQGISDKLCYGEHAELQLQAQVAAFTASGLVKLGLDGAAISTFPNAFQEGMAAPDRRRALGDETTKNWRWGGEGDEFGVDAVLLLYASTAGELDGQLREARQRLDAGRHLVLKEVPLREVPEKDPKTGERAIFEPFGFRDGISQPVMRGSKRWSAAENAIHLVEPGELVLGYRDDLGNLNPSPCSNGEDIGRNGTFLVIRQLEQHVARFQDYVRQEAGRLARDPRAPPFRDAELEHWVGARMVGRWRDGSSLVRNAHPPAAAENPVHPDNDFRFGREDPDGLRCPLGAHIRRANPRDSFEPGSEVQLAISNRHRILRVGRVYEPEAGKNPGLLFMCLNADIERQFEFLQQTWLLGSNFHGLDDEIDPVVGYRGKGDSMSVPTPRGPMRLRGLAKFVTMRGGGYFFVPGKNTIRVLSS